MRPEIKERIEKIQNGVVPEGYKKEKHYLLPADWEFEKLGNLVKKIVGGGTPSRAVEEYYNGDIPWATVKDLSDANYKADTLEYITKRALENSSAKLILKGCFIISTRMGLGRGFINQVPMAINQDLKGIYTKQDKLNVEFLMYWYKYICNYIESLGSGSTVKGIDLKTLKNLELRVPSYDEQQKIANILSTWDKAIELKEKLIQAKKEQKRGLIQALLSGEKRLKGFSGEWDQYYLGDIVHFKKGKGLSKDKVKDDGKYKCILYGELYTTYNEVINEIKSYTDELDSVYSQSNDILIPASTTTNARDLATASAVCESEVLLGGDINILRQKEKNIFRNTFLAYYLKYIRTKEMAALAQGITIIHLYGKELSGLKISLPPIEEQNAISNLLEYMEEEIYLLNREITLVKQEKKGLMQLLLTGIVRVNEL